MAICSVYAGAARTHPDVKTSIAILNAKLGNTNDDKKRNLFQAMKDMLEYMDEKHPTSSFISVRMTLTMCGKN